MVESTITIVGLQDLFLGILDLVTQVATHHGQTGPGSPAWLDRDGRDIQRRTGGRSADSLHPFVIECVEPGSTLHTEGWQGYAGLEKKGFEREISVTRAKRKDASKLLPRVHRVAALLKRWLLGTHQGAVARWQLPYYLDKFTFGFNRRTSKSRGKLFFRLMQQAVNTPPATYEDVIRVSPAPQPIGAG